MQVRIPFYGDYNETDPVKIAEEGQDFAQQTYDNVLIYLL